MDSYPFERIILEPEQQGLLMLLVEADRSVPRELREKFLVAETDHGAFLKHPGVQDERSRVYFGDLEALDRVRLLSLSRYQGRLPMFDVTPLGFEYYRYLRTRLGQPVERIERVTRSYLDGAAFQRNYSAAFQKWLQAEELLWSADSSQQLTSVGHHCREAVQEFAAILVERYKPHDAPSVKAAVSLRIGSVLRMRAESIGGTVGPFLDSLLTYWEKVVDLAQRQEHGGQKEGRPLVWEDARRLVFQTAVVMFEVDQAISRP